jgi:ATP-dependent Clp protease ATP-binding subunit ClpC
MDACNILKPALARGEVSCIGATTLSEYKKTIRKDGALSRRFHPIKVNEPSTEETLKILKGISPFYEKYHKVKYRDEALTYCVNLAEKYVNEGNFPDKAIDILDHAGSKCKIKNFNIPDAIKDLEKTISERIDSTSYLHNGSMTGDLEELFEKYESMLKEWDKDYEKNLPIISKKEILDIVSEKCNVSIKDMDESTVEKAKSLNRFLSRKLINQKDAIKSLS